MEQPIPEEWELILPAHVAFFTALDDLAGCGKIRFAQYATINSCAVPVSE
ncbi:MAG: hypothetical protein K0S58_2906 [Nitrospira sp.]|nr:hypothetical protein [Nitrospira sp.]